MLGLIISTILTSAADSINPIAITQQFVLQGMVKKPKHIWYFIIPTGVTNLIGGFLAYFGLIAFIADFFTGLISSYGRLLYTVELIVGVGFIMAVVYLIKSSLGRAQNKTIAKSNNEEETAARKIKSVSPPALIALGIGATISELTTALPYFAFLAILFNYQLTFAEVTFILILYNFIYTLPLMILYFVYAKAQDKFDNLYTAIKNKMTKWSNILAPTLVGVIGVFLISHSTLLLLK
ncbi:MAG: GAP family protein [Oscillospiraceae bacterium]